MPFIRSAGTLHAQRVANELTQPGTNKPCFCFSLFLPPFTSFSILGRCSLCVIRPLTNPGQLSSLMSQALLCSMVSPIKAFLHWAESTLCSNHSRTCHLCASPLFSNMSHTDTLREFWAYYSQPLIQPHTHWLGISSVFTIYSSVRIWPCWSPEQWITASRTYMPKLSWWLRSWTRKCKFTDM